MRTTLNRDEQVLLVARQLARQRGATAGRVISDLARQALEIDRPPRMHKGAPLFALEVGAGKPHLELVNQLRDEP